MLGLYTLDVGIGMALMFLFVSLIASAIREFGETILKTRSAFLERGIREMMGETSTESYNTNKAAIVKSMAAVETRRAAIARQGVVAAATALPDAKDAPFAGTAALYNHFLISSLYVGEYGKTEAGNLPSYIPSANFARAALDLAGRAGRIAATTVLVANDIREGIEALPNGRLRAAVLNALDVAGDDLAQTQRALEQWFDASMDRVSGWYKRRTQYWLFGIGLLAAIIMNIDAVQVMQTLSTDADLRRQVVTVAGAKLAEQSSASAATPAEAVERVKQATAEMGEVNWPIGWSADRPGPQWRALAPGRDLFWFWVRVAIGWLITGLGVTFGAAFWFDVLNKFMVIRSTVKPDEKSPREKSKDARPTTPAVGAAPVAVPYTAPPPATTNP